MTSVIFLFLLYFRPETSYFIKQVEAEKQKKEKGETEDNRSFIAKYVSYNIILL